MCIICWKCELWKGGIVAGLWFNLLNGREALGKVADVYGAELQSVQDEDTEVEWL